MHHLMHTDAYTPLKCVVSSEGGRGGGGGCQAREGLPLFKAFLVSFNLTGFISMSSSMRGDDGCGDCEGVSRGE